MAMSEQTIRTQARRDDLARPRGGGDYAAAVNVGDRERWASILGGGALALYGITRGTLGGLALALVAGSLVYRGVSGHCPVYGALGIDRSGHEDAITGNLGVKVERSVVIDAAPETLWTFWRNLENLPRVMANVERVRVLSPTRSRWAVKAPAGMTVEWDAEIINEKPNELIAWRSVDNAIVDHAGSVRFEPAPGGRGSIVRVSVQYDPLGGAAGHRLTALLGQDPGTQLEQDLQRFKRAMETAA